jgi:hypothetical protein
MGTLEAIERIGGIAIEDTGVEVDEATVNTNEPGAFPGLTRKNFDPTPRSPFQTQVTSQQAP